MDANKTTIHRNPNIVHTIHYIRTPHQKYTVFFARHFVNFLGSNHLIFWGGLWFFFLCKLFFSPAAKNNLFFSRQVENNFFLSILALHIVAAEGETNNFFFSESKTNYFFLQKLETNFFFQKKPQPPPRKSNGCCLMIYRLQTKKY